MTSYYINQNQAGTKGMLVGQKLPLKLEEIWSIRTRLYISYNLRELGSVLNCKK